VSELRDFQSHLQNLVTFRGYEKIILDFSRTQVAFAECLVPLIAYVRKLQSDLVDFECIFPDEEKLGKLFRNANWAFLLDPKNNQQSAYNAPRNIPARVFRSIDNQVEVLNSLMHATMDALYWLQRSHLTALEWALNEVMDNTLTHSECPEGGVVQLSLHPRTKDIEFVVADAGIGIPNSLRSALEFSNVQDDLEALQLALKEGVTRGTGQGNGLFGSSQISALSGGRFHVNSGRAYISLSKGGGVEAATHQNRVHRHRRGLHNKCLDPSIIGEFAEAWRKGIRNNGHY
jgi:hypothetical protein